MPKRFAARLARRVLPRPTPYCIVTRGRSGSNLVCSLLASHPQVRDEGEAIGDWRFTREGSTLRTRLLEQGSVAFVDALYRRRWRESAAGFKVLYYQIEAEYAQRRGVPDLPQVLDYLRTRRGVRIIHLKRRNRLETLVSKEIAAAVREHVLFEGEGAANSATIRLTPDECEEEFRRIGDWEEHYDEVFARHRILEITYEDLVADLDGTMGRVQAFLGVSPSTLHTRMRKQIRRPMSEVVENFDDLRRHFAGTAWAAYFEDGAVS